MSSLPASMATHSSDGGETVALDLTLTPQLRRAEKLTQGKGKAGAKGTIEGYPIKDFYLTNPIARASETMQRCSAELLHGESFAEAAE